MAPTRNSSKSDPSTGTERDVELLAPRQKQLIRQSLTSRFAAFLKPGEALEVDAEQADAYVYGKISVTSADDSFRLDVEASILAADQQNGAIEHPEGALELTLEFLKRQLYDFFRQDRQERFHVDWRLYPVDTATIRFRGQIRKPGLERQADKWLDEDNSVAASSDESN